MYNTTLKHIEIYANSLSFLDSIIKYRNVRKNWDNQRIGTRLKIVKIIILADPKNWTILKKKKISGILAIQRIGTVFWGPQNDQKRA